MATRGAKSKYAALVEPYLDKINEMVRKGVTEKEIAKALGITEQTLNNYKNKYTELVEALSKDKGADALQGIINAGIEAAQGYWREIEQTVIVLDEDGNPVKRQKTITKQWYPANSSLNQFYAKQFGKEQGITSDPLELEFKKQKQALDEAAFKAKNWDIEL